MIKCLSCPYCHFWKGNGNPSRWYCDHKDSPSVKNGLAGATLLNKGQRRDKKENLPRKSEPKWCPLKEVANEKNKN